MATAIEKRVRTLERTNRIAVGVALLLVCTVLVGSSSKGGKTDTVRAQRFELVDVAGAVLAVLGADAEGSTGLFVQDPQGGLRIALAHDPGQSALFIHDAEGTVRIGIAQFAHGGGGVALHGAESKGAAVLYHKETGSLAFYDKAGTATLRVPSAGP